MTPADRQEPSEIEMTPGQVRQLAKDAAMVACAAMIYVPPNGNSRTMAAAARILKRLKLGMMVPKTVKR